MQTELIRKRVLGQKKSGLNQELFVGKAVGEGILLLGTAWIAGWAQSHTECKDWPFWCRALEYPARVAFLGMSNDRATCSIEHLVFATAQSLSLHLRP